MENVDLFHYGNKELSAYDVGDIVVIKNPYTKQPYLGYVSRKNETVACKTVIYVTMYIDDQSMETDVDDKNRLDFIKPKGTDDEIVYGGPMTTADMDAVLLCNANNEDGIIPKRYAVIERERERERTLLS
jgi:hypothetical protein